MTKKRFCKLIMAAGYDRNQANQFAGAASGALSYQELFFSTSCPISIEKLAAQFEEVLQCFVDALPQVIQTVCEKLQAFVNFRGDDDL